MKIMSLDAETNGLHGQAFALAAVVTGHDGAEIARFVARCPVDGDLNNWVRDNVMPRIEDIPQTHDSYGAMLDAFYAFYMAHRDGADVVAHIGWPVETRVLSDVFSRPGREWDGPLPLLDASAFLRCRGDDPLSVDAYNATHGLTVPFDGSPHHPLYDAWAAERCTRHILTERATS